MSYSAQHGTTWRMSAYCPQGPVRYEVAHLSGSKGVWDFLKGNPTLTEVEKNFLEEAIAFILLGDGRMDEEDEWKYKWCLYQLVFGELEICASDWDAYYLLPAVYLRAARRAEVYSRESWCHDSWVNILRRAEGMFRRVAEEAAEPGNRFGGYFKEHFQSLL